jgi:hypothetical protein
MTTSGVPSQQVWLFKLITRSMVDMTTCNLWLTIKPHSDIIAQGFDQVMKRV